jgi:hypothetical protein
VSQSRSGAEFGVFTETRLGGEQILIGVEKT